MLGKIEGRRRRGCQRMRWLDGITNAMNMNLGQILGDGEGQGGLCAAVHGAAKSQTLPSDRTTTGIKADCLLEVMKSRKK